MNEKLMMYLGSFKDKYPHHLEPKYARIVEKIVQLWGKPEIADYFADLLMDKRGGRQGFPADVAREIFLLSVTYDEIQAKQTEKTDVGNAGDVWHDERPEAKRAIEQLQLRFVPSHMLKAAESADPSRVLLYLKAGMPVDTRDEREWTPLMVAAFNGNEAVAKLLIQHGADVHARDRAGYTPMHWAALNGYKEVVRLLVTKGVNGNAQSNFGLTSLLQAAAKGHAAVVAILLEAGADPNIASNDGWTPLHKAVANGQTETIAILLAAGASVQAEHQDGSTPLSIAEKGKWPEVLAMLRRSVI